MKSFLKITKRLCTILLIVTLTQGNYKLFCLVFIQLFILNLIKWQFKKDLQSSEQHGRHDRLKVG